MFKLTLYNNFNKCKCVLPDTYQYIDDIYNIYKLGLFDKWLGVMLKCVTNMYIVHTKVCSHYLYFIYNKIEISSNMLLKGMYCGNTIGLYSKV